MRFNSNAPFSGLISMIRFALFAAAQALQSIRIDRKSTTGTAAAQVQHQMPSASRAWSRYWKTSGRN